MNSAPAPDWRPLTPDQATEWAALLAAIEVADQHGEHYSEQDLRAEFEDPARHFDRGSVAVYDGPVMVGFNVLGSLVVGTVHECHQWGGVHPGYRGRGLGTWLLAWAEHTSLPLHRELFDGQPLTLAGECLCHNREAVALFAAGGYQESRWFHAMTRDMSQPLPGATALAGTKIVGFTPARSADALLVRNEAFRDHWGARQRSAEDWAHVTGLPAFRPAFSFVAYAGTEPLGMIMATEWEANNEATGLRDLYIPTIGTRRTGRGRGIASALLVRAMTEARAAGFDTASLTVDADSATGAVGLYRRLGFEVLYTAVAERKPLLPAG